MRVTQGMLTNNMLRNLMNSQQRMNTYLEQMSTGKKINRPSQDPVIAVKGINFRKQVEQISQYKRNASEIHSWMDNSDAALDKTTHTLQRVRELTLQANNSHYGADERESIKQEIEQLMDHLVELANTSVNDRYIFNGTNTAEKPVEYDGTNITVNHNTDSFFIPISNQTSIQANVDPSKVFTQEMFDDLKELIARLENGDDLNTSLGAIDNHLNNTINARAELGARMNRLELIENRLDEQEIIATRTMSENEDIHMEEAITNLITQESLHRAALAAGSRIIQPTLIDFLR